MAWGQRYETEETMATMTEGDAFPRIGDYLYLLLKRDDELVIRRINPNAPPSTPAGQYHMVPVGRPDDLDWQPD